MIQRDFPITNQSGLHVRPASVLVNGMGKFGSEIEIVFGGQTYNAKSVINVLSAGIKMGDTITIRAQGPDEEAAMEEADRLIRSGLGE